MKTIYRVIKNKDNPYVQINKALINNPKISLKAKAILIYLLSKPDNWQVYESDIVLHCKDGRDSIRSGIKELISLGYIHRYRFRDEKGMLRQAEYTVFEEPITEDGLSKDGLSNIGKPNTTNNNLTKTDLSPKEPSYYTNRTTRTIADQTSPNDP